MNQSSLPNQVKTSSVNRPSDLKVFIYAVLLVLAVMSGVWAAFQLAHQWQTRSGLFEVTVPQYAPSASWDTLLATAQKEAAKVGDEVLFTGVAAHVRTSDVAATGLPNKFVDATLDLEFRFRNAAGDFLTIRMVDVDPPLVTGVTRSPSSEGTISPANFREAADWSSRALATMKLSPREVLANTLDEGLSLGPGALTAGPEARIDNQWQATFGMPIIWNITYSAPVDPADRNKLFVPSKFLLLRVNPTTGEIIDRRRTGDDITPTPLQP